MNTCTIRKKRRINIELPETIITQLDGLARRMNESRSEVIRKFIIEKVLEKEKEELERSMKDGYLANYDFIKQGSSEWDSSFEDGI
jgi:metal-responsive CopG/Arc/MetJ family transcriptional regulator